MVDQNFIPVTQGQGQGAAQVFAPQARPIDTSSLERGMYVAAGAFANAQQAKKEAEAKAAEEKRKADQDARLKAMEEARKVAAGEYKVYNEAKQQINDDFFDAYLNKQNIAADDLMIAQQEWSGKIKAVEAMENQEKQQMDYLNSHRDVKAFDPETGTYLDAYTVRAKELTRPLNEDEVKITLEGRFPDLAAQQYTDFGNHIIKYDEQFSLPDEVTKRFKEWATSNGMTTSQVEGINDEYDVKRTLTYLPESSREDFVKFMKSDQVRQTMQPKWFTNTLVEENLPTRKLNLADPELARMTRDRYDEAIDGILLPKYIKEEESIVQAPDKKAERVYGAGEGGNEQWSWQMNEIDRQSKNQGEGSYIQKGLKKFTFSRIDQPGNKEESFPDSRSGGTGEVRIVPLSVEEKTPGKWILSGGKSVPVYELDENGKVKKDKQGAPIPVYDSEAKPTYKWEVIELPYTEEVAAKMKTNTASPKAAGFDLDVELKKQSSVKENNVKYKTSTGYAYTRSELKGAGWTDAQIDQLEKE